MTILEIALICALGLHLLIDLFAVVILGYFKTMKELQYCNYFGENNE